MKVGCVIFNCTVYFTAFLFEPAWFFSVPREGYSLPPVSTVRDKELESIMANLIFTFYIIVFIVFQLKCKITCFKNLKDQRYYPFHLLFLLELLVQQEHGLKTSKQPRCRLSKSREVPDTGHFCLNLLDYCE